MPVVCTPAGKATRVCPVLSNSTPSLEEKYLLPSSTSYALTVSAANAASSVVVMRASLETFTVSTDVPSSGCEPSTSSPAGSVNSVRDGQSAKASEPMLYTVFKKRTSRSIVLP